MKYLYLPLLFLIAVLIFDSCKKEDTYTNKDDHQTTDTTSHDTTTNDTTAQLPCNGHPSLCDSMYNHLCFVMPHNAQAYTPVFSPLNANQEKDVSGQLADGVRAFTFKTYYTDDNSCGVLDVYVYHGYPSLGCEPFSKWLDVIHDFLESHPREVITLGIEGSAGVLQMQQSFIDADLVKYFYVQHFGDPWPTLGEMIDSNKRLVVFTDRGSDNDLVDGFHNYWQFIVDNNYNAQQLSDFDCEWSRGNPNGDLYLFNHFITRITPQKDSAAVINSYPVLMGRVQQCIQYHGRKPNFLHVDFYDLGDCFQVADELNGVN